MFVRINVAVIQIFKCVHGFHPFPSQTPYHSRCRKSGTFQNKKAATVSDSRCVGYTILLAVVLFLFAVNGDADHCAAADEQQCNPQHGVAVVAGARVGLRRIGWFCCGAGSRNLNCCLLVAANLSLLMLGALLRCGRFLVNNPLEVVCRLIGLISARALTPVVVGIVLPVGAVAVKKII